MSEETRRRVASETLRDSPAVVKETSSQETAPVYEFGPFRLDPAERKLWRGNEIVALTPKAFDTLYLLVRNSGRVLEKDDLISFLWPDTFVEDGSLTNHIFLLRKALGENPSYIETVPRRGYRFVGAVRQLPHAAPRPLEEVREVYQERPRKRKREWEIAGVGVSVLILTVAGGLLWRSRHERRLTDQDTIVLADFVNTTGEPVFDDTLKQGLRVQLEQSPFLNILADQKVDEQLKLMAQPTGELLTPPLARELCQRVGSKAMLMGTISKLGMHYVVGLKAVNCESGDTLASEQVEAGSREHVLKALGESAMKMREKLGESLASIRKYDAPEERTTGSLEALKAFSLGLKVLSAKGDAAGLPFFQRAVELDPEFAAAYGRMGTIYMELYEIKMAAENTRRAYELRGKVSARERLYIDSHYHSFVTGDLQKAEQVYEVWQQTYPRDITPYSNLSDLYAELGKYEKALEEAREELGLYPNVGDSYVNASFSYIALNRLDEAEAVFEEAGERKLESEQLLLNRYQLAFLNGRGAEMKRIVEIATGKPGEEDLLLSAESDTEAYGGHLAKARELSRRSVESARRAGNLETGALWEANAALREAEFGNAASGRRDAAAALALASGRGVKELAALTLALCGNGTEAEKITKELKKDFPLHTMLHSYWLPTIRAAIEIDRKNFTRSIELLQDAASYELGEPEPYVGWMHPVYIRGQAYLAAHKGKEAAAEFQKILDHRTIVLNGPIGALAHLQLGRAYELAGDTSKARAAYQDFLTLWKDADPDTPILREAKVEYAKLM